MKQNNSCGVVVTPITLPLILVFLLMCPCVLGDEIFFMLAHCDNDNTLLEVLPHRPFTHDYHVELYID